MWGAKGEWGRVSFGVVCDVVVFFFCGEWRRVRGNGGESALELCVLSSSSFGAAGGESASGGAKGEWGRVSFGVGYVVVFFFCGEWRRVSFRGCEGGMM